MSGYTRLRTFSGAAVLGSIAIIASAVLVNQAVKHVLEQKNAELKDLLLRYREAPTRAEKETLAQSLNVGIHTLYNRATHASKMMPWL